uniref:Candidate secreted effector n=1 Tax=Meloidogyne incognita TaxID=6306 RepID=A0A914L044_MELIC
MPPYAAVSNSIIPSVWPLSVYPSRTRSFCASATIVAITRAAFLPYTTCYWARNKNSSCLPPFGNPVHNTSASDDLRHES